jgi:hypothetical protein
MQRRFIVTYLLTAAVAFVAGAAVLWFVYLNRIEAQIRAAGDQLLLDRTMVLQFIREGHISHAESHLESTAWGRIVSVGNRVAQGEAAPPEVIPSIEYHCDHLRKFAEQRDPKLIEQRSHWCKLLVQR